MAEILELATEMRNTGRSIEDVFDFSFGILSTGEQRKRGLWIISITLRSTAI